MITLLKLLINCVEPTTSSVVVYQSRIIEKTPFSQRQINWQHLWHARALEWVVRESCLARYEKKSFWYCGGLVLLNLFLYRVVWYREDCSSCLASLEFNNLWSTTPLLQINRYLLEGYFPPHFRQEYIRLLCFLLFGSHSQYSRWQSNWTPDFIIQQILSHKLSHHKLLYGISQLLCSYIWSSILYDSVTSNLHPDDESTLDFYCHFLLCLLRQNHFMKVLYIYESIICF